MPVPVSLPGGWNMRPAVPVSQTGALARETRVASGYRSHRNVTAGAATSSQAPQRHRRHRNVIARTALLAGTVTSPPPQSTRRTRRWMCVLTGDISFGPGWVFFCELPLLVLLWCRGLAWPSSSLRTSASFYEKGQFGKVHRGGPLSGARGVGPPRTILLFALGRSDASGVLVHAGVRVPRSMLHTPRRLLCEAGRRTQSSRTRSGGTIGSRSW